MDSGGQPIKLVFRILRLQSFGIIKLHRHYSFRAGSIPILGAESLGQCGIRGTEELGGIESKRSRGIYQLDERVGSVWIQSPFVRAERVLVFWLGQSHRA